MSESSSLFASNGTEPKYGTADFGNNSLPSTLFGNGKFSPLQQTGQSFEELYLSGVHCKVFDHPFENKSVNSARICNQGSAYPSGPQGTCGCCSCGTIINKAGGQTDEKRVVDYALSKGLCSPTGGTSPNSWISILGGAGIKAHDSSGKSLSELAKEVESGHGVVIGVCACTYCPQLYGRYFPGMATGHALVLESVIRNKNTNEIIEYVVSDSNGTSAADACRRVPAKTLEAAFRMKQCRAVVTDSIIW